MNNFDLKKFLIENKLTSNSRLNEVPTSVDSLQQIAEDIVWMLYEFAADTDLYYLNNTFDLGLSDEEAEGPYEGYEFDTAIQNAIIEDPTRDFNLWERVLYDDDTEEFDLSRWEDKCPKTVARLKEMDIEDAEDEIIAAIQKLEPKS